MCSVLEWSRLLLLFVSLVCRKIVFINFVVLFFVFFVFKLDYKIRSLTGYNFPTTVSARPLSEKSVFRLFKI